MEWIRRNIELFISKREEWEIVEESGKQLYVYLRNGNEGEAIKATNMPTKEHGLKGGHGWIWLVVKTRTRTRKGTHQESGHQHITSATWYIRERPSFLRSSERLFFGIAISLPSSIGS